MSYSLVVVDIVEKSLRNSQTRNDGDKKVIKSETTEID
jgi:hypothetical protein